MRGEERCDAAWMLGPRALWVRLGNRPRSQVRVIMPNALLLHRRPKGPRAERRGTVRLFSCQRSIIVPKATGNDKSSAMRRIQRQALAASHI